MKTFLEAVAKYAQSEYGVDVRIEQDSADANGWWYLAVYDDGESVVEVPIREVAALEINFQTIGMVELRLQRYSTTVSSFVDKSKHSVVAFFLA